jgi:precorrin-2 dehydrogenase/sirohydrochlorin ferrochelatase
MIPLMIDLTGKKVVIFGGGEVAARKAAFFAQEADVVVVSRSFTADLQALPVERVQEDLAVGERGTVDRVLQGAFLAVPATSDPAVNRFLRTVCRSAGVLVNDTMGEGGDVIVPSVVQGEGYVVAISTGGRAPTLPRFLREHLEATFPQMEAMVRLQEQVRRLLREQGVAWQERSDILHAVLSDAEVWSALAQGGDAAEDLVRRRYLHA